MSKIFILSKHDVKSTLSRFMEPKDFPKRYGGELEWEWGDLPHLDEVTRAAVEKDGNKGWVRGPCLWLDGQRVVVGSVNGQPRTPDAEVQKRKPVIYAADYTETPVHPDKKLSRTANPAGTANMANGTAAAHHRAEEAAEAAGTDGATAANIIATESNAEPHAGRSFQPSIHSTTTHHNHHHNHHHHHILPHHHHQQPQPHAPSMPQPGPVPAHAVAMTHAVAAQLADESVSTIPAAANGHAGPAQAHPEVIVASDPSKGLAIEAERLTLVEDSPSGAANVEKEVDVHVERPPIERFVTAAEM